MKQNIKEFFPILILDIIGIFSIFQVILKQNIFTIKEYMGIFFLLVVTISFFIERKIYQKILLFVLLLGMFGLISFSTYIITFGFLFIHVYLIPFFILILYMYIYNKDLKKYFTISENEKKESSLRLEKKFKRKFSKLSDEEIEIKLEENLIPEAIKALKNIKNTRANKEKQS